MPAKNSCAPYTHTHTRTHARTHTRTIESASSRLPLFLDPPPHALPLRRVRLIVFKHAQKVKYKSMQAFFHSDAYLFMLNVNNPSILVHPRILFILFFVIKPGIWQEFHVDLFSNWNAMSVSVEFCPPPSRQTALHIILLSTVADPSNISHTLARRKR